MATNIVIKNARFVSFEDNKLEDFLKPKESKNTKNCTKTTVTLFKKFCAETTSTLDIDIVTPQELDNLLIRFYSGARKPNGEFYKINTMRTVPMDSRKRYD